MSRVERGEETIKIISRDGKVSAIINLTDFLYDNIPDELDAIYDAIYDELDRTFQVLFYRNIDFEKLKNIADNSSGEDIEDKLYDYLYDVCDLTRKQIIRKILEVLGILRKQQY